MNWENILTGLVALYGAALATYLGIRELRKERRDLLIILERIDIYERVNFRLVNSGVRPITIVNIGMLVFQANDGANPPHWEDVPAKYMIPDEYEDGTATLPALIKDGEQIVIPITENIGYMLMTNRMKAKVFVHDAEGHVYTKFKTIEVNPKHDFLPRIKE